MTEYLCVTVNSFLRFLRKLKLVHQVTAQLWCPTNMHNQCGGAMVSIASSAIARTPTKRKKESCLRNRTLACLAKVAGFARGREPRSLSRSIPDHTFSARTRPPRPHACASGYRSRLRKKAGTQLVLPKELRSHMRGRIHASKTAPLRVRLRGGSSARIFLLPASQEGGDQG